MYAFSFLCVVGALYFTLKKGDKISAIVAMVLIMISTAIYQAYIGVYITMGLIYYICYLFKANDIVQLLKYSVRTIGITCGGMLLYLISNKLVQNYYGVIAVDGRGFSTMGQLKLGETISNIGKSYVYFVQYYFGDQLINNGVGHRKEINILFFTVLVYLVISAYVCLKKVWKKIAFVVFIMIIPIVEMIIVIIAPEADILDTTGILMLPTMVGTYILGIVLFNQMYVNNTIVKYVTIVVEALVLYMCAIINISG